MLLFVSLARYDYRLLSPNLTRLVEVFLSWRLARLVNMFLSPKLTRFVEMLLFDPIDSLNASVIISKNDSFLLHAEINRVRLALLSCCYPGGGSLLPHVIIALADSLCLIVIIPTDDSLCPNAVINRL